MMTHNKMISFIDFSYLSKKGRPSLSYKRYLDRFLNIFLQKTFFFLIGLLPKYKHAVANYECLEKSL